MTLSRNSKPARWSRDSKPSTTPSAEAASTPP